MIQKFTLQYTKLQILRQFATDSSSIRQIGRWGATYRELHLCWHVFESDRGHASSWMSHVWIFHKLSVMIYCTAGDFSSEKLLEWSDWLCLRRNTVEERRTEFLFIATTFLWYENPPSSPIRFQNYIFTSSARFNLVTCILWWRCYM